MSVKKGGNGEGVPKAMPFTDLASGCRGYIFGKDYMEYYMQKYFGNVKYIHYF